MGMRAWWRMPCLRAMPAAIEGFALVFVIAAIAAVVGVRFGIVLLAPRITRMLDRADKEDEEPGDRDH
jgi:hypothetical protein